jgi:hypothetical protein
MVLQLTVKLIHQEVTQLYRVDTHKKLQIIIRAVKLILQLIQQATAPAMSVYSQQSCVIPLSIGMTVIGFSTSLGTYHHDLKCEQRQRAKLLNGLGMKVAAISLMCQDKDIWKAMMDAGTPCPIDGLIGEQAKQRWEELGNEKHLDNTATTFSRKFRHHR